MVEHTQSTVGIDEDIINTYIACIASLIGLSMQAMMSEYHPHQQVSCLFSQSYSDSNH